MCFLFVLLLFLRSSGKKLKDEHKKEIAPLVSALLLSCSGFGVASQMLLPDQSCC